MNTTGKKIRHLINSCWLIIGASMLLSCTDGGGIQIAEGGISGTGISSGSITGFSSVILNGRKLEITAQTEIYVDEQLSNQSALKVGQVVRVEADFDTDTANRIDYVETVLGPLSSKPVFDPDTLAGSLEILGQTVLTNSATVFDGATDMSILTAGKVLEVSGVRNADGEIVARYIELKTLPVDSYRVLGTVSKLSTSGFNIADLTVDISKLSATGINEDDEVRVKADISSLNGNVLVADKITPSTLKVVLSAGDDLELEGVVTGFQSLSNMIVNGLSVNAADASIENGEVKDIAPGKLVEIEGSVDDSETLQATKVKIIPVSNIRIEALVETVDTETQSIVVMGQQFFLDEKTQLEDNSSLKNDEFSLSDLNEGEWVEIRAFSLDNKLILTRLERDDPDSDLDVRILGPVEAINKTNYTVTVLGIVLSTGSDTKYENLTQLEISKIDFFGAVESGDLIKARWRPFTDPLLPVDELSIED